MRSRPVVAPLVLLTIAGLSAAGCLERNIASQDARTSASVTEPLKPSGVERIDLLFAIDNSSSMGDKQEILARAVPDLVKRLANPHCVDADGAVVDGQPESPTASCPPGSEREFVAVPDIHIGIVSSSLGSSSDSYFCNDADENDHGRLLSRGTGDKAVATYGGHGFLAWDPDKKLDPPGQSVLDAGGAGLVPDLQEMVRGVGEAGCGYEGQLESWYRFLIDPEPYESLVRKGDDLIPQGVDKTVLDQRKQFLRPDSLVAIIMLTDENDCSVMVGKGARSARMYSEAPMVRPRSECATNADDPCCAPCDEAPAGCDPDPSCKDGNGQIVRLAPEDDHSNLRCFDQKRRFGKSFLYPIERYSAALKGAEVPGQDGELRPNPLYMDLDPEDNLHGSRGPGLVFVAGIVGVPWQDIAKDPLSLVSGLKSARELNARNLKGQSGWDIILGDPSKGVPPLDPHMKEDTAPRPGENPATGTSMAGPDAGPGADPISGHEQPALKSGLQYACTFPLLAPITAASNDCQSPEGNPLCQDASGAYTKTQLYGKAFPALRELGLLRQLEDQAIVASVCPANMDEATEAGAPDFGYRPAIGALVDRLKDKLSHQCLSRQLTPDDDNQVRCLVVEARKADACSCNAEDGRVAVTQDHGPAVIEAMDSGVIDKSDNCFCEVPQLEGEQLAACQNDKADPLVVDSRPVDGWCYIDATSLPPVGSADLVPASCPSTERRLIRLVGNAKARPGSTLFIRCTEG